MNKPSKFDVDKERYGYLDPLWKVLESVPSDMKMTMKEAGEKSGLDPTIAAPLIQEMSIEFQKRMMKNLTSLIWKQNELTDSWTFDKIMLLSNRIDTGSEIGDDIDPKLRQFSDPVLKKWNNKWREKRGV
jgi:hypothetical protein